MNFYNYYAYQIGDEGNIVELFRRRLKEKYPDILPLEAFLYFTDGDAIKNRYLTPDIVLVSCLNKFNKFDTIAESGELPTRDRGSPREGGNETLLLPEMGQAGERISSFLFGEIYNSQA